MEGRRHSCYRWLLNDRDVLRWDSDLRNGSTSLDVIQKTLYNDCPRKGKGLRHGMGLIWVGVLVCGVRSNTWKVASDLMARRTMVMSFSSMPVSRRKIHLRASLKFDSCATSCDEWKMSQCHNSHLQILAPVLYDCQWLTLMNITLGHQGVRHLSTRLPIESFWMHRPSERQRGMQCSYKNSGGFRNMKKSFLSKQRYWMKHNKRDTHPFRERILFPEIVI